MKPILFLLTFACTLSVYSQTTANATDGLYVFDKAVLTDYKYGTKEVALTHAFNDTTALKDFAEVSYMPQPIFLWAWIYGNTVTVCKLWNNGKEYFVQGTDWGYQLIPVPSDYHLSPVQEEEEETAFDVFLQHFSLSPLNTLVLDEKANTATYTFILSFSGGGYDFQVERKFTIVLKKAE